MGTRKCLVTNIFQNIFFCVDQKKIHLYRIETTWRWEKTFAKQIKTWTSRKQSLQLRSKNGKMFDLQNQLIQHQIYVTVKALLRSSTSSVLMRSSSRVRGSWVSGSPCSCRDSERSMKNTRIACRDANTIKAAIATIMNHEHAASIHLTGINALHECLKF